MPTTRKYLQAVAPVFPGPFAAAQVHLNSHHNQKQNTGIHPQFFAASGTPSIQAQACEEK
jgi:hypothetical protein